MAPFPHARYQVGIALRQDRVAVPAQADCFALAQAQQVVIGRLLRHGDWAAIVVIVRLDDGAVLDRLLVSAALDA
jgi:hypothetical protein